MRAQLLRAVGTLRLDDRADDVEHHHDDAGRLPPPVPGHRWGALRGGAAQLDGLVAPAGVGQPAAGPVPGGRQRAPGPGRADGGDVGPIGGRDAAGAPRFDQPVAPGAYLWWYVDAISDDGRHALTIIAFVGSVFSPYYAFAQRGGRQAAAENHCAINVALYGDAGRRWAMTERGAGHVQRSARSFAVGPSALEWQGDALTIRLDERNVPWPSRVRGTVRVWPKALSRLVMPLDDGGRHRWGPIAPCSRIEVAMDTPAARWSGDAYLDANEGDEPISRPFTEWDWSRATLRDGSSAVVYDVRQKTGAERVLALRYAPGGAVEPFEPPPRRLLPRTGWRMRRSVRSDATPTPRVVQTLEDTPFYVRSVLQASQLGEPVTLMHETLNVPRLVSPAVQFMLPWRMPRRG